MTLDIRKEFELESELLEALSLSPSNLLALL